MSLAKRLADLERRIIVPVEDQDIVVTYTILDVGEEPPVEGQPDVSVTETVQARPGATTTTRVIQLERGAGE